MTEVISLCDKQEHADANCPAVVLPLILVPLHLTREELETLLYRLKLQR